MWTCEREVTGAYPKRGSHPVLLGGRSGHKRAWVVTEPKSKEAVWGCQSQAEGKTMCLQWGFSISSFQVRFHLLSLSCYVPCCLPSENWGVGVKGYHLRTCVEVYLRVGTLSNPSCMGYCHKLLSPLVESFVWYSLLSAKRQTPPFTVFFYGDVDAEERER